jgi:hypothetical protein
MSSILFNPMFDNKFDIWFSDDGINMITPEFDQFGMELTVSESCNDMVNFSHSMCLYDVEFRFAFKLQEYLIVKSS